MSGTVERKKSKYDRILSLYSALEAGKCVVKTEAAADFGVNERTVQRDIDDIRAFYANNTYGVGSGRRVIYDRGQGGFRLENGAVSTLSNGEILTVCKILLESRSLVREEMMPLIGKLVECCVPKENRRAVDGLINNEKFHYVEPRHGKTLVERIWQAGSAVREQRATEITYTRLKDKATVRRRVKPVGLMMSEFYFYLIAYIEIPEGKALSDPRAGRFPTIYRLDRIGELNVTDEHFRVPYADRFEEGEFRKRIQFMYGGDLRTVRFTYSGESVEAVLDRLPTARILSEADGVYTVEAEVFGDGIDMWLRSQGERVSLIP